MSTETLSPPPLDTDDDPDVVRALEYYLAEVEAGRAPDRAALLAENPHVADQLAECLDGIDFLRLAVAPDDSQTPWPTADRRLGEYRLLRVLGRGGMGTVYEAEEAATGDRVAVKVLTIAAGSGDAERRRFQHEIHAASSLTHPNIVPVLTVGTDRGVHFFAMKLIAGRSLADLIARPSRGGRTTRPRRRPNEPTPPPESTIEYVASEFLPVSDAATVTGYLLQAADALDHAHAAGIVHRDVKPANLLLDDTGNVWVADFGLAFVPGLTRLTHSSALVGTLRYMSPEQVEPRRGVVDHRADLYGLGATAYELLTRRPVFDDTDRGALVQRILNVEPQAPRGIDPAIPYDLETIVLKLLAKDPARRYASMADLADDLRRFRAGEPVRARRPSLADRGITWLDQHRQLAAAALMVTVAVMALVIGILNWKNAHIARERDDADRAVDAMYTHFAETVLSREPRQEPRHGEFLLKALKHYERRSAEPGASEESRLSAALAWRRVADISARLGRDDEAIRAYDRAVSRLQELAGENPAAPQLRRELAVAVNDRGNWHRGHGHADDARQDYRHAAELFAELRAGGSTELFDRVATAGIENNLGLLAVSTGNAADAERWFRSARARYAQLAIDVPGRTEFLSDAAMSSHNLAEVFSSTGRAADAEPLARDALTLHERAFADDPGSPVRRCELARTRLTYGTILTGLGKRDEAAAVLAKSVDGWRQLAADYPHNPGYRAGADRAANALASARGAR